MSEERVRDILLEAGDFKQYPVWFKKVLARRVLLILLPEEISSNLPRWLSDILNAPIDNWPEGTIFPPGVILPPGVTFPPGWTAGDPLPAGVILPPGITFPPGWTPADPLPAGIILPAGTALPAGAKSGEPLPPGIILAPGQIFPIGWTAGDPLPGGIILPPGVIFPKGWTTNPPSAAALLSYRFIPVYDVIHGYIVSMYVMIFSPGPTRRPADTKPSTAWTPDLLNDHCVSLDSWGVVLFQNASVTVDPASYFDFDTGTPPG